MGNLLDKERLRATKLDNGGFATELLRLMNPMESMLAYRETCTSLVPLVGSMVLFFREIEPCRQVGRNAAPTTSEFGTGTEIEIAADGDGNIVPVGNITEG